MSQHLLDAALAALRAGVSIIPIDRRTKRPYGKLLPDKVDDQGQLVIDPKTGKPEKTWKPYQERYATEDEVCTWHDAGAQFAAVGGAISGGLECIDHDDVHGRLLYDAWRADVGDLADALPVQQTGGGGYQVVYRYNTDTPYDGNQKLAWLPDETQDTGRNVIEAYNHATTIADELRQHGYKDAAHGRLIRPNAEADSQPGVVLGSGDHANMSFHHSSNDALNDGYWHTPFDVRCHFDFAGVVKDAVRALAVELGIDYLSTIPEPARDADGWALCPHCGARLRPAKNGNGWRCLKEGGELCFWWKGEDYTAPEEQPEAAGDRPTIDISTLDLPTVVPQAWDAIIAANDPPTLFQRAGELARLETTDSDALVVKTVDTRRMTGSLARAARWVRVSYDRRGGATEKETIPPAAVVDDCMVNIDPRIPVLTRVVHAPTFADCDVLLAEPGYHAATRIYYDPKAGASVPPVPDQPSAADLDRARALILDDLLIDFPFVSEADRAHAIALFLLPFIRELISGPTPLHLIEAPTMGSGKGLLAGALLLPALGTPPAPMTEATTDEEWGKTITSNLLAAPAVILIDNLNRKLASGKLAAALTTTEFSDRILGRSEQIALPVRCVWVATANNPTLSTEIARRCIRIRIDPRVDKPWDRKDFKHPMLHTWIEAHRGDLIWAALVICRYGLQHGTAGRPLGSYEPWSDVMGRILNGAGFVGFLGNLDALYDRADVEGTAWRALISAWWEKHQSTPTPASELFPLVAEVEADVLIAGKDEDGRKKSFGKALARALERVFSVETDGGTLRFQVVTDGVRHKTKLWKLAPIKEGGIGGVGGLFQPHARKNNFSTSPVGINPPNTHNPPAVPPLPAYAMWHGPEYDQEVTVVGVLGEQDGVQYLAIEGSQTGIPAHEVEFFEEVIGDSP